MLGKIGMNVERAHQDTVTLGVNRAISMAVVASHGTGNVLHCEGKLFEHGVLVGINLLYGGRIAKVGNVVQRTSLFWEIRC